MKLAKKIYNFARSSRPSLVITLETLAGLVLCLLSLVIFLFFTSEMLEAEFNSLDVQVIHQVYSLRTPELTRAMILVSSLGSSMTLTVVLLVMVLVLMLKNHRKEAFIFCLTLLMGVMLSLLLKSLIQRPRPQLSPLIVERTSSFPSSHAMNSLIFFSLLWYFSYHFFHKKWVTVLSFLASTCAVLIIGFSRIYLGVHYLTDIVAGYIAGFWWFVTVLLVDRTFIFYRVFKKSEE